MATMVVVPPLVRATRHLADPNSASNLSLNRGFDSPQAKCQVQALVAVRTWATPKDLGLLVPAHETRPIVTDEALPDSPSDAAPDALRGPPAHLLV
jgi:hypothetical protein